MICFLQVVLGFSTVHIYREIIQFGNEETGNQSTRSGYRPRVDAGFVYQDLDRKVVVVVKADE